MAWIIRTLSSRFRRSSAPSQPPDSIASGSVRKKELMCKVLLLDGAHLNVVVPKNALGSEVYEEVFYSLDLEERDYFGLQYTDHYNVQHWLDPAKKVSAQVDIGPPFTFRFRVKFFTSEPGNNLKEELTRYQFFLQLKQDISSGRLACPRAVAVDLAAYALQSELGDYNPQEHTALLISEFRFHPEQDETMETEILEKFKSCRGHSPAQAELAFLNKAKWLEFYGVDMHTVEGRDGNVYHLGLTPQGMLVFDGDQKIGLFMWERLQKLDFKNKKITIVVEEDDVANNGQIQLHTFVFNLSSEKAAKHFWKCAVEHHSFFRLKCTPTATSRKREFFRLGSTFKYRGKTEYETVHKESARLSRRVSNSFERRPSQRYGARQSHTTTREAKRNEIRQQAESALRAQTMNSQIPAPSTSHVTKISVEPSVVLVQNHQQQTSASRIPVLSTSNSQNLQDSRGVGGVKVVVQQQSRIPQPSYPRAPTSFCAPSQLHQPTQVPKRIVTNF